MKHNSNEPRIRNQVMFWLVSNVSNAGWKVDHMKYYFAPKVPWSTFRAIYTSKLGDMQSHQRVCGGLFRLFWLKEHENPLNVTQNYKGAKKLEDRKTYEEHFHEVV